jgi:hypothetical protein
MRQVCVGLLAARRYRRNGQLAEKPILVARPTQNRRVIP